MLTTLTYSDHACSGRAYGNHHLLIDPYISRNKFAAFKSDDAIFVDYFFPMRGNEDHIANAPSIATPTGAMVISYLGVARSIEKKGIERSQNLSIGGSLSLPFGKIKYMSAAHSSNTPKGIYGDMLDGFVFDFSDLCVCSEIDTELMVDTQLIAKGIDVGHAVLPKGRTYTVGVAEAMLAAGFVNCMSAVGACYTTSPAIAMSTAVATEKLESAGINLTLMEIGETKEFEIWER